VFNINGFHVHKLYVFKVTKFCVSDGAFVGAH
jgi:hypothetical protein